MSSSLCVPETLVLFLESVADFDSGLLLYLYAIVFRSISFIVPRPELFSLVSCDLVSRLEQAFLLLFKVVLDCVACKDALLRLWNEFLFRVLLCLLLSGFLDCFSHVLRAIASRTDIVIEFLLC